MKTLHLRLLAFLLAAPALFLLNSCEKEEDNGAAQIKLKADYEMPGIELMEMPELQLATEDEDFAILNDGMPGDLETDLDNMELARVLSHHPGRACNPARLLDSLNLTASQRQLLRQAFIDRHRCTRSFFVRIRTHNRQVLQRAKHARQQLLQDFRSGTIDRQQLHNRLNQLNQSTRTALVNHKERRLLIRNIRQCHQSFLVQLNQILTQPQLRLWIAFHHRCTR